MTRLQAGGAVLYLSTCLTLSPAGIAHAQAHPMTIGSDATCPECRVVLEPLVEFGDAEGGGALTASPVFVIHMPGQGWVVAEHQLGTRLVVFSEDGRFSREVGREGEGPGEFRGIVTGFREVRTGHLHVYDAVLRRETTFDASLELVSTSPVDELNVLGVAADSSGRVYYNADVLTPAAIGYPLHTMGSDGFLRSFGAETPVYRPDAPWLVQRALAADEVGLWTARRTHYRLEFWSPEGELVRSLERAVGVKVVVA